MDELIDPFRRLLADACPPDAVRRVEGGGDWVSMWDAFAVSGFLDAMIAEDRGGAGLTLSDVSPLIALLGAWSVPLPIADTMVARALLSAAGADIPERPVVLATGAHGTPFAGCATYGLRGPLSAPHLIELDEAGAPCHSGGPAGPAVEDQMRPIAAVLRAQLIAGAADRVLEMTVDYANERTQFGKPIGRQQAVQQQLAELSELVVASRIAAAIGARTGLVCASSDAAIAKYVASVAAPRIAAIGHAVHGAIGISEEHGLQLLTRRLHAWRLADGSETYWADRLGEWMWADRARADEELPFPGRVRVSPLGTLKS